MKLKVWENVIVSWVNAFSLPEISDVHELKNGNFFLNILDKLQYKGDSNLRDDFYSSEEIHPYIAAFIKEIYPEYEAPCKLNGSEDITLIASLVLLWFCLKTKDRELLLPLYSLENSTQCCIQAFLEKLLYIPSSSIAKDLVFSAILSIDDPFAKDDTSVIYSSPASPSLYRSPVYDKNREENRILRRDNELLKSENSYLIGELEQQKVEHSKLAKDVDVKSKEILRLENELFVLSGEASAQKFGIKEKRKSGSKEKKLKNEVDELEKAIVSSKQEINSLSEDRNQLRKRVGALERESISWKERATELEDKCLSFEALINQNESVINQLQQTVVEQREFLSETNHGHVSIGNDSSFMCEDVCSPAAPENLTSIVELKFNELENNYQSMVAEFNKAKIALQDKDKRIYSLMAEINSNSSEINLLKGDLVKRNESLQEKVSQIEILEKDIANFQDNLDALNRERENILSEVNCLNETVLNLKNENSNLANKLNNLNDIFNENNLALDDKMNEITILKDAAVEKDDSLNKALSELDNCKVQLVENEEKINSYCLQIEKLKESLEGREENLKATNDIVESLQNSLIEKDSSVEELKKHIELKETILTELKEEITCLKSEKEILLEKKCNEYEQIDKTLLEKENDLARTKAELTKLISTLKEKDEALKKSFAETKQVSDILLDKEQFIIKIDLEMQEIKHLLYSKDANLNNSQTEIECLKSQLMEKDSLLKVSDTKITKLKNLLNVNNNITEKIKAETTELEECLSLKQEALDKSQHEIETLKEAFKIKETESKELKEIINRSNVEMKKLSESVAAKGEMLKMTEFENKEFSNSLRDLEHNVALLKDSLAEKETIIDRLTKESDALKLEVEVKSNEIKEWALKLDTTIHETILLKDQLHSEVSTRVKLEDSNENLKTILSKIEAEKLNLVNQVKSLSCTISACENEKYRYSEEIKCLTDERDSLKISLENKTVVAEELQSKICSLNSTISEFTFKYEKVVEENNELSNRSEDLNKLTRELKNQCLSATKEMKAYKNRVNELEREVKVALEDKSSVLSQLEESNENLQRISHLENEISNLNEFINLDKLQTKKISEEKQQLSEEMSFKQREIEGLTLQLIESKKINEKETDKYEELSDKCNEIKKLNESHLNDLVVQRKRVTELEAENLQYIFEISNLTEAREKLEQKYKREIETLSTSSTSNNNLLKVQISDLQSEKEKLIDAKLVLERQVQNLESSLKEKAEEEIKKLNDALVVHNSNLQCIKDENTILCNEIVLFKNNIDEMSKFLNEQESKMTEMGFEMKRIMKEKQKSEIEVDRCNKERFKWKQEKSELEEEVNRKTIELNTVKADLDKLKCSGCEMELAVVNLKNEVSRLSINEDSYNAKIKVLTKEIEEKTSSLLELESRISELNSQWENEKILVSELMSENKRVIDEKQFLLSTNQELQLCLQEKISSFVEMEQKVTAVDEIVDSKKAEVTQLKAEKKALEDDLTSFNAKSNSLMSEINNLTQELSTKTFANKSLNDEVAFQKDLLSKSESKNKELTNRVETLNNLIMQYCITIQENTTYVSELKCKMNNLKENLSDKSGELNKLSDNYKSIDIKLDESIKHNEWLNSEITSFKTKINEMETRAIELRRYVTQIECEKRDLYTERNQLSNIISVYTDKLKSVNDKLLSSKKSLMNAEVEIKNFQNEIADKNNEINILNNNISGLKFGLVENSKLLKQILNETRFFGEVTMRIHGDLNESFRINSSSFIDESDSEIIAPKEDSPFDPAFTKWRDLQSEIIKALKSQLDCVYSAAKEKDMLCNDLNIKINDLVSEKRQESVLCENYKAQVSELKEQIDEVTKSTRKLLAEKDDTILALKEELTFLSDSEVKDGLELRIKIERLIEFNSELEFKLNQAQLERDFFKEESEQLAALKNDIKEKDSIVLKMEQDIEMLKHEKNVLDKRVAFLTKDAEDVKSLKIELSDIKNKFDIIDSEETCSGDIDHLTDEEKLTRIKPEFLKNDLEPDDRRLSGTRSLQGIDGKPKKEVGQIIYRKPGPPTPSKNAGRLSLSDAIGLPSTSGLREQNVIQKTDEKSTPQAHTKIKSLFTTKPKQAAQGGVTKKKSGFFRRKKERENISPT